MKTIQEEIQEAKNKVAPWRAKYPNLFAELDFLEIQDGWHDLIDRLCGIVQRHIDGHLPDELKDQIRFTQIKQKFGGLRVHVNHWVPYIQGAITMAEDISYKTCEMCGRDADTHNVRGWITTLCEQHLQEAQEKKDR